MTLRSRNIAVLLLAAGVCLPVPAGAAPEQLRGKSVIVSWTENRVQRNVSEDDFRSVTISHEFRAYVSSAGRVFSRLTNVNQRGRSGTQERVGGGANLNSSFGSRSMTIAMTRAARGVRLIVVEFGGRFDSCTADVRRGKEVGADTMAVTSRITGKKMEIKSVTVSDASCSIRPGNVFDGES